jgi:pimeloyl-ACP methyl ester carboxylesterase
VTAASTRVRDASSFVTLPSGRRLAYAEAGDPDGVPVVVFHGLPGSRLQQHPDDSIARNAGAWLIHVDRPGFGRSDPCPGRTLDAWPRDVAALADALALGRFAVVGLSGGGPFALACAALLGERLTRVAVVSGVGSPGSMPMRGTTLPVWLAFGMAHASPWLLSAALGAAAQLGRAYPDRYLDVVASHMAPADRPILARPEVRAMYARDLPEAFRQGTGAMVDDLSLLSRPWDLPLERVSVPVRFWHGDADRMVPVSAAQHLAAATPGATLTLCQGEGHFLILDRWAEVLRWGVA